ncbi:uncharacterized protein LOC129244613 [Anastrepha obliqua]|uniref:uncharacterized protein LOC129244613 n=1 Tax=Anastrepha obliqua TaxID=95512 RepID=UPI0024090B4C|nr:uncharacterized protein LOC129244613 [Anastrepha obliqua]
MAKTSESVEIGPRRKSTVWTREKITQLIELYRQHDCLWNHYTEAYKNKEKRTKAIEDICSNLRITKMDFGKKIHNLRNQFNSEMKKLERRVEETGDDTESKTEGCRWKHFQALKFLRDVIEPRPGGYQSKMRRMDSNIKYDITSEDETEQQSTKPANVQNSNDTLEQITQYQFEDSIMVSDYEVGVVDHVSPSKTKNCNAQRNESTTSMLVIGSKGSHYLPSKQASQRVKCNEDHNRVCNKQDQISPQRLKSQCQEISIEDSQHEQATNYHHNPKGDQCGQNTSDIVSKKSLDDTCMILRSRDQWDAFGELIATEFRHLNSDTSRKKLKRKIMQAMLEVGEEDDLISI